MSKKRGLGKFFAGALVGAGLGVLFAPKTGSETRESVKAYMDDLITKVKRLDKEEVRAELESRLYDIKDALDELDKETVLKTAEKEAKKLKLMSSELVDYAKEKGTPILEDAAVKVRDAVLDTVNKVIEKLEVKESK